MGPVLRRLGTSSSSNEVQKRVADLLKKMGEDRIAIDESRCSRAVEVLEYVGTSEAMRLLRGQAHGEPSSQFTQDAKAALDRLVITGAAR